jgi:hypothetical protein
MTKSISKNTKQLFILPIKTAEKLRKYAYDFDTNKSAIVRAALELYFSEIVTKGS